MSLPNADGRVVLITGATGGLGRELVESFGHAGWRIAAVGHAARPLPATGVIWAGQADVTNSGSVQRVFDEVEGLIGGGLDALVNNAGVVDDRLLGQMTDDAWDRVVGVSLKGAFLCSRAALGPMVRRGAGHILNVASFAARSGVIGQSNYAAAKAGLVGLTLALAREVGGQGICVNAVLPGVMSTPMTAGLSPEVMERFAGASVLGRIQSLGEAARWMTVLAASRDVSGQVWALDGRIGRWC